MSNREISEGSKGQSEELGSPFDAMLFHSTAAKCFKEMAGNNEIPQGFPSTAINPSKFATTALLNPPETPHFSDIQPMKSATF